MRLQPPLIVICPPLQTKNKNTSRLEEREQETYLLVIIAWLEQWLYLADSIKAVTQHPTKIYLWFVAN